jgi:hypothetical protein
VPVGSFHLSADDIPMQEIAQRETQAITGQPIDPPGGG